MTESLFNQAKNTDFGDDQSVETSGGVQRLPKNGTHRGRLIGYIDFGLQPQEYQGEAKDPANEIQLVFELTMAEDMYEVEIDGKKKKFGTIVRTPHIAQKQSPKANFRKLFKQMDYGRGITHLANMLGEVFAVTTEECESKAGKKYAKITNIGSPLRAEVVDEDSGEVLKPAKNWTDTCPPTNRDPQLFVFESPNFEQWKSIENNSTRTVKSKDKDGKEVEEEVSNNFIQDKITSSLNWEGSAMQTLLNGLDEDSVKEDAPKEPAKKTAPAKKAKEAVKEEAPKEPEAEALPAEGNLIDELGLSDE